jgi:hypothetical protein
MNLSDPVTGRPLPPDSLQRVLHITPKVHVYNPPPLTGTSSGHIAATWTSPVNRQIFTARLRILETSVPQDDGSERIKADVLLEDPESGELFAAAPYTVPAVVEQAVDSSRFFAIRVMDPSGRKAMLGIGFEERSEAFDFSVALQEVRKTLQFEDMTADSRLGPAGRKKTPDSGKVERDFSLQEGQTITVNLGGKMGKGRRRGREGEEEGRAAAGASLAGFALPPPPSGGTPFLPPPPSAQEVKAQKRLSRSAEPVVQGSIEDMGFDDGEFGEFQ